MTPLAVLPCLLSLACLQRCLHQFPAALLPALLLCHTLVITGNQEDAAAVVLSAVNASGRSAEALSLLASVQERAALQALAAASDGLLTGLGTQASQHTAVNIRASHAGSAASAVVAVNGLNDVVYDDDSGEDVMSVHEYVGVCLEVLQTDAWQLGAVEGMNHLYA